MLTVVRLVKYVCFSTETVMEEQKQTSEEEQTQHNGRKIKWSFVSGYLNLYYCLNHAVSAIMFHRAKNKLNITF